MADESKTTTTPDEAKAKTPPTGWHKFAAIPADLAAEFADHIFHVKHPERGVSAVTGLVRAHEACQQPGFEPATEAEWHKHIGFKKGK